VSAAEREQLGIIVASANCGTTMPIKIYTIVMIAVYVGKGVVLGRMFSTARQGHQDFPRLENTNNTL
jgi:hypothetical protein